MPLRWGGSLLTRRPADLCDLWRGVRQPDEPVVSGADRGAHRRRRPQARVVDRFVAGTACRGAGDGADRWSRRGSISSGPSSSGALFVGGLARHRSAGGGDPGRRSPSWYSACNGIVGRWSSALWLPRSCRSAIGRSTSLPAALRGRDRRPAVGGQLLASPPRGLFGRPPPVLGGAIVVAFR